MGFLVSALLVAAALVGAPNAVGKPNCGPSIEKSHGKAWRCTFADDFRGSQLNSAKWLPVQTQDTGYTNGQTACFTNDQRNVSVSGGVLRLTARQEPAPFTCWDPSGSFTTQYTGATVSTAEGRFEQAHGRFEVRARISPAWVRGLQTSFWLFPVDSSRFGPWPASGEIDFAEMYSAYAGRVVPYVHYDPVPANHTVTTMRCAIRNPAAFHTYATVWTRTMIKMIYDGRTCLTVRWMGGTELAAAKPFNQPFFISLTQALGVGANEFDPVSTPLPATTEVDYVRAWK